MVTQREIKFRIWSNFDKSFRGDISNENCGYEETCLMDCFNNANYELQQYTGLHDKNGKEIYEGDIVKITLEEDYHEHDEYCEKPCTFPDEGKTTEVKWNEGGFTWDETELFDGEYQCGFNYEPYVYEVIGNIYETKEAK